MVSISIAKVTLLACIALLAMVCPTHAYLQVWEHSHYRGKSVIYRFKRGQQKAYVGQMNS